MYLPKYLARVNNYPWVHPVGLGAVLVCAFALMQWAPHYDMLNYHLYVAQLFLQDRWGRDFMAAGVVSTANPYAYLPLYYLTSWQWHAWTITVTYGAIHVLAIVLLWQLARKFTVSLWEQYFIVLLGISTPLFLLEFGTSFSDIISQILVFAAVLALLQYLAVPAAKHIWVVGLCLGVAVGLKQVNVIYVLAIVPFVIAAVRNIRLTVSLGVAVILGYLLINGYWVWRTYETFGNPFFPILNKIPFFTTEWYQSGSIRDNLFVDHSFWDFVSLPFIMAIPVQQIYTEGVAGDVKMAALTLASVAVLIVVLLRRVRLPGVSILWYSPAFVVVGITLVSYPIWWFFFGNGRYFLPTLGLSAVAIFILLRKLISQRWRLIIIAALVLIQLYLIEDLRWRGPGAQPITSPGMNVTIPSHIASRPGVFLFHAHGISQAYLGMSLHPKSRLANINWHYGLNLQNNPGIPDMLRSGMPVYSVMPPTKLPVPYAVAAAALNADLRRFGRVVESCDRGTFNGGTFAICKTVPVTPPRSSTPPLDVVFEEFLRRLNARCRLTAVDNFVPVNLVNYSDKNPEVITPYVSKHLFERNVDLLADGSPLLVISSRVKVASIGLPFKRLTPAAADHIPCEILSEIIPTTNRDYR